MNRTLRNHWDLFEQWQKEMFDFYGERQNDTSRVEGSDWIPAVDIKEEEDKLILYADVPGIKTEEIDVSMEDGVLTIKGERYHESEDCKNKTGFKRLERAHGLFIRRFALPTGVDAANITASSKDGVLEIILPKNKPKQPQRIEVKC